MQRLRKAIVGLLSSLVAAALVMGAVTPAQALAPIPTELIIQPAGAAQESSSRMMQIPVSVKLVNKNTGEEIQPAQYGDSLSFTAYVLPEQGGRALAFATLKPSTSSLVTHNLTSDHDLAASYAGNATYAPAESTKHRVLWAYSGFGPSVVKTTLSKTKFIEGETVKVSVAVSNVNSPGDAFLTGTGQLLVDGVPKGPWFSIIEGVAEVTVSASAFPSTGSHNVSVRYHRGGTGEGTSTPVPLHMSASSSVAVTSVPQVSRYGTSTLLGVKVTTKPAMVNPLNQGTVTAYDGADRTTPIGSAELRADVATVGVDAHLSAGVHDIQLVFTPSQYEESFLAASPATSQSIDVKKLTPTVTLALTPGQVTPTGASSAKVTVTAPNVVATKINGGRVALVDADGNTVGSSSTLSNGVASIAIPAGTFPNGTVNAIRARVTGHPNLADADSAPQNLTVLKKFDNASAVPTISAPKGPRTGETVFAIDPTWTPTTGYTYQWLLDGEPLKNADGTNATASSYTIKAADARTQEKGQLQVKVTSTRSDYEATSQTSAATRVIGATVVAKPTLSDAAAIKVGKQVTANLSNWPANTQWKYEWFVDGISKGAPSITNTYTPVIADAEKRLTVRVTGTPDGYDPISETSEPATVIGVFQTKPAPTISSSTTSVRVGSELTANTTDFSPAQGSFTYKWFRSGTTDAIAEGKTYTVTSDDAGRTLRVEATAHRNGFDDAIVSSNATAAVTEGKFEQTRTTLSEEPKKGIPVSASTEFWSPKLSSPTPQYQWYLGTTSTNGTPIQDATSARYTPLASDVDKFLSVKVTGTLPGYETATATSLPVKVVDVYFAKPAPGITGSAKTGNTVSVKANSWTPVTAFTTRWLIGGDEVGAGTSYTIAQSDAGKELRVEVTSTAAGFEHVAVASQPIRVVGVHRNLSTPVIDAPNGVHVGASVTATTPNWPSGITSTYEWFAGSTSLGDPSESPEFTVPASAAMRTLTVKVHGEQADYDPVDLTSTGRAVDAVFDVGSTFITSSTSEYRVGATLTAETRNWGPEVPTFTVSWFRDGLTDAIATGPSYKLTASDQNRTLHASVRATRGGYKPVTVATDSTPSVGEGRYSAHPVTISGDVVAGNTVFASTADWLPEEPTQKQYQWYLTDTAGTTTAIEGFTGRAYVPQRVDAGKKLSVRVIGTSPGFEQITETSARSTITMLPQFDTKHTPTIAAPNGVKPGATVTANVDAWTPATPFAYQWTLDGAPISRATNQTYVVQPGDVNGKLRVEVSSTLATHERTTLVSDPRTVEVAFDTSTKPVITGSGEVGKELSVTTGTWSPTPTFAYEWLRGEGEGQQVVGQAAKYTPTEADLGATIKVRVTATAANGASLTLTSEQGKVITAAVNPGTVTIPTAAKVGDTVTATTAGWPEGAVLKYQWLRKGVPITGATAKDFKLTKSDWKYAISVKITVENSDLTATSNAFTTAGGVITAGTIKVSGTPKVGSTVRASASGWPKNQGVVYTYRWYRNGKAIPKATKSSYKLTTADRGRSIQVRVYAKATAYYSTYRTSAKVKIR